MRNVRLLNNCDNYEHLTNVKFDKEKFPIAYNNKLNELLEMKLPMEDAVNTIKNNEIELEIYYEPNYGMFAVESDAVENGANIVSPYSGRSYKYEDFEEEEFMVTLYSLVDEEDNTKIPIAYVNNEAEDDVPERLVEIIENKFINGIRNPMGEKKEIPDKEKMIEEVRKFIDDPYNYHAELTMFDSTYSLVYDKIFAI